MLKVDVKKVEKCISRARQYLLSRQYEDGYWWGALEADVSVVADFIILTRILGIYSKKREKKAINYFLDRQNSDGSWSLFWKGEGSLDITVKTYFCLKLCGISPRHDFMEKAKKFILDNGGIEEINTYTKIILALSGQYSWKGIPEIPPEIIFLPSWFYINIYDFASWTRATIMAFSIIISLKPVFKVKEEESIFDLYVNRKRVSNPVSYKAKHLYSLENIFVLLNGAFKSWDRMPKKIRLGRGAAIKKVEQWILDHQEDDGSWGGIMLPWLFSLIALKCLGYKNTHPVIQKGLKGLEDFIIEDSKALLLQPATSPVWDTAWSLIALRESGIDSKSPELIKGANWLLSRQINTAGDWKIKNPKTRPGCWSFEFENKFYPDIDDTSIVCLALSLVELPCRQEKEEAIRKGINWVLDMQNRDGSWAAFDRNNNKGILKHIPFADFITPLDFGSPDITAHVLSVLGRLGYTSSNHSSNYKDDIHGIYSTSKHSSSSSGGDSNNKAVLNALNYLMKTQKSDGSWYGRWGVNYIYGTSKVLQAFKAVSSNGFKNNGYHNYLKRAMEWLKNCQGSDGGWGESCKSYETSKYYKLEESTASQTAWALLGLLSGEGISVRVVKGIEYLTGSQKDDGSWSEEYFTGGGFPGAFYLKYELYKDYFPLMALAKFMRVRQ